MKILKHLLMLVALLTYSHGLWAYATAYVADGCAGKGYVYATTKANETEIEKITGWEGASKQIQVSGNQNTKLPNVNEQWYVYAKPQDGCTFKGWSYENSVDGEIESTDPKYLATYLGSGDQNLYAIFEGEGLQTLPITVVKEGDANGGSIVVPSGAMKGDKVTITQEAANGYALAYMYAKDADGNDVPITWANNFISTSITFTMPATAVTITARFGKTHYITSWRGDLTKQSLNSLNTNFYLVGVGLGTAVSQAPEGATVRMVTYPSYPFYKMAKEAIAVDSLGNPVTLTKISDNNAIYPTCDTVTYTFTMPEYRVYDSVYYERCNVEVPVEEINKGKDGRYYASFYSNGSYSHVVPEGALAQTFKVVDGELVVSRTFNPGDVVRGTQAVIVSSETKDNITLTPYGGKLTNVPASDSESMLQSQIGLKSETDSTYAYYVFATDASNTPGTAGFYYQNGQEGGYRIQRSPAYKVWMKVPRETAADSKGWAFGDGKTTGIEGIKNEELRIKNSFWYTLDGRQIEEPTQKGIYIHNGKKVVVK